MTKRRNFSREDRINQKRKQVKIKNQNCGWVRLRKMQLCNAVSYSLPYSFLSYVHFAFISKTSDSSRNRYVSHLYAAWRIGKGGGGCGVFQWNQEGEKNRSLTRKCLMLWSMRALIQLSQWREFQFMLKKIASNYRELIRPMKLV